MHKSQRDKVKSETFYHVLQKSNNENETEPQQTDVVDAPLNYQGFKKIYMVRMFFSNIVFNVQQNKTCENYKKCHFISFVVYNFFLPQTEELIFSYIQCIFFNCCHRELHGKTYTPC
jgi:hypothetical protein